MTVRILLVFGVVLSMCMPALAQQEAQAREAFEAGREAYEHGQFAEALAHFEHAYALSARPQLLFNIGRAADSDGQAERAITAYSSYLEASSEADNVEFVKARLDKLRERTPVKPVKKEEPPPERRRSLNPAAITLGAAALASAGVFVGYAIAASKAYDRCDGPRFCSDDEYASEYSRKIYIADGFAAAALAIGITSTVLFFVQRARDTQRAIDLRVGLTPSQGRVVLHGQF